MMQVRVDLGKNSYRAVVGRGSVERIGQLIKTDSRRGFIVADRALTGPRRRLAAALKRAGWRVEECPVEAGESLKDFERTLPIYGWLLDRRADRSSVLFALGGGTVGDAAGFVAATYMRGIRWVGVPTTLLAQVDSSLGGKTGLNHPSGKNLVGAFHQPSLVVCDLDFLETLTRREMISGLAEMIKYGLVFDQKFFTTIADHWSDLIDRQTRWLAPAVRTSLQWKAKVVSLDEHDRSGRREALNFGHTFGHALEAATGYGHFQHGEAVLWGMRFALALSRLKGALSAADFERADRVLAGVPVPPLPAGVEWESLGRHLARDKKVRDGRLRYVLLNKLGRCYSDSSVTPQEQRKAFLEIATRFRLGATHAG